MSSAFSRPFRRLAALLPRKVSRFRKDRDGATAIEFALIALPFFALMLAILETALVFFAGQTMETAVAQAGRLIRTGQVQSANLSASQFKDRICGFMSNLFSCSEKLRVDVRTYQTYGDIAAVDPLDEEGNLINTFQYTPGGGGDLVVVRAFYEWPIYANILGGRGMANMGNNSRLLGAVAAFRNEPF